MEVYLYRNDEQFGPYTVEEVQAFVDDGTYTPIDSAWFEGCGEWTTVSHLPGIVISDEKRHLHLVPPFEAYAGDKPYVFVSYAHVDGELVFREIKKLHEAGYRIWYDEGIEPGNDWPEHIAKAVIDCSLFLIFTSPRSAASENCRNEVNLALNRKKKFLAVYLEETDLPPGLELRMGDLQAILKFRMPDATYRKKLFTGLENMLGEGGRDLPEGEDPVAAAMAIEIDADYLMAPREDDGGAAHAPVPRARPAKDKRKWIAGGVVAVFCLVWLISSFFSGDPVPKTGTKGAVPPAAAVVFTPGKPWTVPTGSIEMIWCEPGTFMMGSPKTEVGREEGKETQHQVTLTKGFYLGKYEVTQDQWKKVMGTSPSKAKGKGLPVVHVSWPEALGFCQKLTISERKAGRLPDGWAYTLPTEAQWEYACRAGTTTATAFGNSLSSAQANFDGTKPYGGAATGPYLEQTTSVGSYQPNAWGFFDMHGNVSEYCADGYGKYPVGPITDPTGAASSGHRVRRGATGHGDGNSMRSAWRGRGKPDGDGNALGFRLSLRQKPPKKVVEQPKVPTPAVVEQPKKPAQTVVKKPKVPTPGQPWTVPSVALDMLWCEPGTFIMGSKENEAKLIKSNRFLETPHRVTLTKGFYLGKYEVTQAQWKKLMKTSASQFKGDKRPVERVSWVGALRFCQMLTILERKAGRLPSDWQYTLPTEAQWEYACRAGTTTANAFGDSISSKQANFDGSKPYGGAAVGPNLQRTTDVGSYKPNAWGFYDMHGNVWEWVADFRGVYSTSSVTDPKGPKFGPARVRRGSSWQGPGRNMRSAIRHQHMPTHIFNDLGFRLSLQQVGK